jgi:hypothetical protein
VDQPLSLWTDGVVMARSNVYEVSAYEAVRTIAK